MNSVKAFVKSPCLCPDNTGLTHLASYGCGSKGSGIGDLGLYLKRGSACVTSIECMVTRAL